MTKFYKVIYGQTTEGIDARYQYSYKDYLVNEWLKENCKSPYYHSPGYLKEKFIEFEDSKDAIWFELRWS